MKRWQWGVVAVFAGIVALEAVVYAQPAPNNCGLNMLCRVKTLIVSGSSTFSGPVTFDGGVVVTGPTTVNGDLAVNGDAGVTGSATVGNDLTVTDDVSADVASVASVEFTGGGTPGLERGGNTTVQTRSGDGFVGLGASGFQSTLYVWDSLHNPATGANCSGNTGSVCINDAAGLCLAGAGDGTTTACLQASSTGAIVLAAGTGTATVRSGAACVCVDRSAVQAVQCEVSGTTLTATGNGTDTIVYICL